MSEAIAPLSYEGILELFRQSDLRFDRRMQDSDLRFEQRIQELIKRQKETDEQIKATTEQMKKTDEQMKKTDEQMKATDKKIGAVDHKVGNMVEKLVGEGNLIDQFRYLGYNVKFHSRKRVFGKKGTDESGEIDLFLEDGDVAILVEAKTTLSMDDVVDHIERLEKYRRFVDADGSNGKRFVGAVAGTVISENVINFAHESGLYVIIQSARAVEILSQPEGFVAKKW